MSRWLNKKFGKQWRPRTWSLLLGGSVLSLFALLSITIASHPPGTTWDFSTASQYTYDSNKIEVTGDVAKLKKSFTITQNTQALFDNYAGVAATYSNTVSASTPTVKITSLTGATLTAPATGTYTSPIFDAGVTATTWKTLTPAGNVYPTAGTATFATKVAVTTAASTIREMAAADFNRDGTPDSTAPISANSTASTILYFNNANPIVTPFPLLSIMDDTGSSLGSCSAGTDGLIRTDGALVITAPVVGDLDNDLDSDLVNATTFKLTGTNTSPNMLSLFINPYVAGGGAAIDPPECFPMSGLNVRYFEDIRLANINGDKYISTDVYKNGRDILDILSAESNIDTGTAKKPAGGIFWLRNDSTIAPDIPVFGTRSIDSCTAAASATGPTTVAAGDFDNDGDIDVVAGWPFTSVSCTNPIGGNRPAGIAPHIRVYINAGNADPPSWLPAAVTTVSPPGFSIYSIPTGESADYSNDIQIGDMDGDGFLDIVHAQRTGTLIQWFKNPCTATPCVDGTSAGQIRATWNSTTISSAATAITTSIALADLDMDGDLDVVANQDSATATSVQWFPNSAWTRNTLATGSFAVGGVAVADLDNPLNNRAPDIIASLSSGAGTIDYFKNTMVHSSLRFQVHSCTQSNCSDNDPTDDAKWYGPDGTAKTFYTFKSGTAATLRVPGNQYFQYKFFFAQNDTTAGNNPRLTSVAVNYERTYFTDSPSIRPNTGVAYTRITDFAETRTTTTNQGTVTYQLCKVGTPDTCYSWTGSGWTGSGSTNATDVKLNIGSFDDNPGHATGTQSSTFYFKAFLNSDGTKPVELDKVEVKADVISLGSLTSPTTGSTLNVDNSVNITWSSYSCEGSPCGTLKFQYTTVFSPGESDWVLITEVSGVTGASFYSWTIPSGAASTTTSVRVLDKDTPVVTQRSGLFEVTGASSGSLTVTNLTGAPPPPPFTVGDSPAINWNYSGPVSSLLRIDYSLDGGNDGYPYVIVANPPGVSKGTGGSGSSTWNDLPASATSTQVKIRLRDSTATPVDGFSPNFTIKGTLALTSPTPGTGAGESYAVGNTATIAWSAVGVPNVKIELTRNASTGSPTYETITSSVSATAATGGCTIPGGATGCYTWAILDGAATSDTKIRVSDTRSGFRPGDTNPVLSLSPNLFTTKGALYMNQAGDAPVSSTVWEVGTTEQIKWHSTGAGGIPNALIEYSKSGGVLVDWETLQASAATVGANGACTPAADVGVLKGGCYAWPITASPDRISKNGKVRVSHSTDTNVTISSDPFNMKGYLEVTEPGNTLTLLTADQDTPNIIWTSIGNIASVNLYYSTDSTNGVNGTWTPINTSGPTANDGTEPWAVPAGAVDLNTYVKVTDADTANHPLTEAPSAFFAVKGKLAFTTVPTGTITVETAQALTWDKSSTLTNLNLDYSLNGTAWTAITTGISGTTYNWMVPPQAIGTSVRLRITDADGTGGSPTHPATSNTSASFVVEGVLTFTASPSGTITVGNQSTVTWTKTSTITISALYYAVGGGRDPDCHDHRSRRGVRDVDRAGGSGGRRRDLETQRCHGRPSSGD